MPSLATEYLRDKKHGAAYDVKNEIDISGKIVLITGANSGIGKVTALELAKRSAIVVMACRDLVKSKEVLQEINKKYPDSQIDLLQLDLSDFENVRRFVQEFKEKYDHLDLLINNAGYYKPTNSPDKLEKTKDGFELHMMVNHLGPFLMTILLLDHLKKGAQSRIVFVASTGYKSAYKTFNIDDLMLEKTKKSFAKELPYGQSKYCNILICRELSKRLKGSGSGITCYSLCPGFVRTNLFRHESWASKLTFKISLLLGVESSPEKGVETVLYCSLCSSISGESGYMYHFNQRFDHANKLLDEKADLCGKLWDKCVELVGIENSVVQEIFDKLFQDQSQDENAQQIVNQVELVIGLVLSS